MPDWLVEPGIGETRAIYVHNGEILESRIEVDGVVRFGTILRARVKTVGRNNRNAIAQDEQGVEYLLPRGAGLASEGGLVTIEVTREAIPGNEPWKRSLARIADDREQPSRKVRHSGAPRPLPFSGSSDQFAELGWNDLIEEARSGTVRFPGGELRIFATPAMTLIDVDGDLPPEELAVEGAVEAARAIRRLAIGGSVGIDLPTIAGKSGRLQSAAAIDRMLPQPFERTAVNGFGFVQIIRPRRHASLLELAADGAAFEARAFMRRIAFERPGPKRLFAHPAVILEIESHTGWIDALARQLGGTIELRSDPSLPMSGGYAQDS